jgi:hypothetical protein
MYCVYNQHGMPINHHVLWMQSTGSAFKSTCTVYAVDRLCLLINMHCAYNQHDMPINQHVLCIESTDTAY